MVLAASPVARRVTRRHGVRGPRRSMLNRKYPWRNRLRKYADRLTTFLREAQVDGTNNAAERALRPAVVMRKITGGSRSESGARAWAVSASVMRTAEQQARDVMDTLKTLLRASWAGQNIALLTDT